MKLDNVGDYKNLWPMKISRSGHTDGRPANNFEVSKGRAVLNSSYMTKQRVNAKFHGDHLDVPPDEKSSSF